MKKKIYLVMIPSILLVMFFGLSAGSSLFYGSMQWLFFVFTISLILLSDWWLLRRYNREKSIKITNLKHKIIKVFLLIINGIITVISWYSLFLVIESHLLTAHNNYSHIFTGITKAIIDPSFLIWFLLSGISIALATILLIPRIIK